jgi:predicted DNA-binding transcriptional regulator YafY
MPEWTFLTNHALVLSYIVNHPRITGRELSDTIGITERATRKIISDLLEAGYIVKTREGRRNHYKVRTNLPLRHATHRETIVGALLEALGWSHHSRKQKSQI